ncbi:hypothetical protein BDZ45DRAFT_118841, partial [Acephala macrosclerotiorum]
MAAVEGLLYYADRPRNDYGSAMIRPWTIGWDEEDTRIRLKLIARAWVQSRTSGQHEGACRTRMEVLPHSDYTWRCRWDRTPLNVPGSLDVFRVGRLQPDDRDVDILEPNTDALARKHAHDSSEARITPPSSVEKETADQSLFRDPTMAPSVDFQSQDGFVQTAKKAKKAAKNAAKAKWGGEEEEEGSKKDEGEGNNGGDNGGDTGAGGSDDKKDETNGDGDANGDGNADDTWDSFVTPKSKKKGKKGKTDDPISDPPAENKADKTDFFQEIKLDDAP